REQYPYTASSQKRVRFEGKTQRWNYLVAADVQQSNRHRFVMQRQNEPLQFVEKIFFGGGQLAREIELLNAQQTHAISATLDGCVGTLIRGKICYNGDSRAIGAYSGLTAVPFTGKKTGAIFFESLFKVLPYLGGG